MKDLSNFYDKMRNTEMNERVGGTDPELVGQACFRIMSRYFVYNDTDNILDFGCGIGRVLVQTATQTGKNVSVTGMDIMPDVIEFCNSAIRSGLENVHFELVAGNNDHYDKFIQSQTAPEKEVTESLYRSSFDKVYAFSVFTHVDHHQFADLLRFVRNTLKPDAIFLFSCFILTPYSRDTIHSNSGLFKFGKSTFEIDDRIFIGNQDDRLAFIAYDIGLLEKMIFDADLVVSFIEYGAWRGDTHSNSLQDIVVVRNRK
jgi:SAM-dependent methyltransferase